jgi:hypothetical protein
MEPQSAPAAGRARIIKVPDATPGILLANGQQQQFVLERIWKSPVAPAVNMTVDIELDGAGSIQGLTVVDQRQLTKERLNQLGGVAQERGKDAAQIAKQGVGALAARMGAVALGSAVIVVIALFFFTAAGVSESMGGPSIGVSWTFWNLLGLNFNDPTSVLGGAAGSSVGFLSLLALIAMVAPFAVPFISAAWSRYLNAAPLAIVVLGFLSTWMGEHKAFSQLTQMGVPNPFSWSWGFYVLALAALVLAAQALKPPASQQS